MDPFQKKRDYVADLATVDKEGNRTVYAFRKDREYTVEHLVSDQLKAEHSNAYIDITGDGAADLLLTTQTGLEMYTRAGSTTIPSFTYLCTVPWPTLDGCDPDQCIGQAVVLTST